MRRALPLPLPLPLPPSLAAPLGAAALLIALATPAVVSAASSRERAASCCDLSGEDVAQDATPVGEIPGVQVLHDIAYGKAPLQRFDVYKPAQAKGAPLLILVHGGGWRFGDKAHRAVVENKVARWVTKGFVVVSVNYRLLPDTPVARQVEDVAQAIAAAQKQAAGWGAERGLTVLMGHSAGAHLVALLAAASDSLAKLDVTPAQGVVLLDSAALDVPAIMNMRHLPLYDRAFGKDPLHWRELSPLHVLDAQGPAVLAVCSSRREQACPQAQAFAKAAELGGRAVQVLPEDLSHREINTELGRESAYTRAVETFMAGLDPRLAERIRGAPASP
ncbi:alpha/beta hydrolase [Niveibacterium sp. SC-1]|uniref:alpha/beta hydrolase n=1 Tax=Niveibacterium sp. SC-1 TaxID=3135646 RepID=UPI00311F0895